MKKHNRNRRIFSAAGALLLGMAAGSTPSIRAQEAIAETPTEEANFQSFAPESAEPQISIEDASPQQLVLILFGPKTTSEQYKAAYAKANATGVSPQVLLESQIVRTFYTQDKEKLVSLRIPLQNYGPNLDLKNSQLFTQRSDFNSILEGIRALESEQNEDAPGFEMHIKEALWQSPPMYQQMFLAWMGEFRQNEERKEAMKKVVVPLDTKLMNSEGTETTLQNALGNNKAILLDFWASWCPPCMASMGELQARGEKLAPQGVVVVGLNTESSIAKAAAVKERENMMLTWLVEPEGEPYSTLLQAETIPRMVLISREGKVLFNGHPNDPILKRALARIGAQL